MTSASQRPAGAPTQRRLPNSWSGKGCGTPRSRRSCGKGRRRLRRVTARLGRARLRIFSTMRRRRRSRNSNSNGAVLPAMMMMLRSYSEQQLLAVASCLGHRQTDVRGALCIYPPHHLVSWLLWRLTAWRPALSVLSISMCRRDNNNNSSSSNSNTLI